MKILKGIGRKENTTLLWKKNNKCFINKTYYQILKTLKSYINFQVYFA